MCIPCVMCGACMDAASDGVRDGRCPACGAEVPPDAVSCPECYTFLPRPPAGAGAADGKAPGGAGRAPAEG